jgi:hypothetical protein
MPPPYRPAPSSLARWPTPKGSTSRRPASVSDAGARHPDDRGAVSTGAPQEPWSPSISTTGSSRTALCSRAETG